MSPEPGTEAELVAACAAEAARLAERSSGAQRKRLLVLAHTLELAGRELAAGGSAELPSDDPELPAAIRHGEHDGELAELGDRLRGAVRRQLATAHPGYDESR